MKQTREPRKNFRADAIADAPLELDAYDPLLFEIQIMTVDEIAEYLKLATKTVYRLAQRNEIPAKRIGKSYRFYLPDIVRWLQTGGDNEKRR